MPIYEYRCTKCGKELEVMQKLSDPAPATCPACNEANSMERLVSRTSFQLKGGGWYSDLYGSVKKDTASTTAAPTPAASGPATPSAAPASSASGTPSTPAANTSSGGGGSGTGSGSGGSSSGGSSTP